MSHHCLERPTSKTCSAVPAASARGLEALAPSPEMSAKPSAASYNTQPLASSHGLPAARCPRTVSKRAEILMEPQRKAWCPAWLD